MSMHATAAQTAKVGKRFSGWWILSAAGFVVVAFRAPQQAEVIAYKLLLVALSVGMAYLADRSLFKNASGIDLAYERDNVTAARLIARAIIFLGLMLGLTLGI